VNGTLVADGLIVGDDAASPASKIIFGAATLSGKYLTDTTATTPNFNFFDLTAGALKAPVAGETYTWDAGSSRWQTP
jgi:hypothetical protein